MPVKVLSRQLNTRSEPSSMLPLPQVLRSSPVAPKWGEGVRLVPSTQPLVYWRNSEKKGRCRVHRPLLAL
jgi:hypothetical protein